jgi:hypothetical protein
VCCCGAASAGSQLPGTSGQEVPEVPGSKSNATATCIVASSPCRASGPLNCASAQGLCRSHACRAARLTAAYALTAGILLVTVPTLVLPLLFPSPTAASREFVQLGGGLLALFGCYYGAVAEGETSGGGFTAFYRSTVLGRAALVVLCVGIWLSGEVGPGILLLVFLNGLGAVAMAVALLRDAAVAGPDAVGSRSASAA